MYIMTPVLTTSRRLRNIVRYTFPNKAVEQRKSMYIVHGMNFRLPRYISLEK